MILKKKASHRLNVRKAFLRLFIGLTRKINFFRKNAVLVENKALVVGVVSHYVSDTDEIEEVFRDFLEAPFFVF